MQTIPTPPLLGPLLAPLSSQSSPSSSFFLDQTTDTAGTQSHRKYEPEDGSSSLLLDDEEDEGASVDEGRLPEKSFWSDDSDLDEDEVVEDQVDDEDSSGKCVMSADDVDAKHQEADGQAFKGAIKDDMEAAVVLQDTGSEEAKLSGDTHTGSACLRNRDLKKDDKIL